MSATNHFIKTELALAGQDRGAAPPGDLLLLLHKHDLVALVADLTVLVVILELILEAVLQYMVFFYSSFFSFFYEGDQV